MQEARGVTVMIDRQGRRRCDSDLYFPGVSSGVHSAGNIDSVPPDTCTGAYEHL